MKRILIYSHDTFGLGNIRRMLEVARHLVETTSRVQVLVVTGSPMLHAFRIPARVDYLKLPCLARDVEGRYAARSLALPLHETVRLRANLIRSAFADFRPDLVVVDKKPFGVEDELAAAFDELPEGPARPRLVLLLRDILDSPEATRHVWRKNGYYEAVAHWYDRVLVVGCPQVFDLRREYDFPPPAAAKVQYCGYIARERGRATRDEARAALGVAAQEPLLLATPGGGADGHALVQALLDAVQAWGDAAMPARPRVHIVCGPEMAAEHHAQLLRQAQALPGVTVQASHDDMMSLQAAADLVLAMGGYNTVCELLSTGRRALLVPRVKPGQEQCIRASRMAAQGLVAMLHPDVLTGDTLREALRHELAQLAAGTPVRPRLRLRMRGLQQCSAALIALLEPRDAHRQRSTTSSARVPARAAAHEGFCHGGVMA